MGAVVHTPAPDHHVPGPESFAGPADHAPDVDVRTPDDSLAAVSESHDRLLALLEGQLRLGPPAPPD
jgi:hypothetical protein